MIIGSVLRIKVGELVRFDHICQGSDLNGRIAVYIGEHYIHRDDGVTVRNHRVWCAGDRVPTIIDYNLLSYMRLLNPNELWNP